MLPDSFFQIKRFPTRCISVGNVPLGGKHPIRLQSMTNTNTENIKDSVSQCIKIIQAGADYVRLSTPGKKSVFALKKVSDELKLAGFNNPLIADIHFNPEVAAEAAKIVEKIRINPGNYVSKRHTGEEIEDETEKIRDRLKPLVDICKDNGTVIRIGTNMGSLSSRVIDRFGNTPKAMVESTVEFIEAFRSLNFENIIISLKSSNPVIMIRSYEMMVQRMLKDGYNYPLHVGITEAGEGENGRIKSALGVSALLNKGIGDTVRVSLTEPPENEILFAKKLTSVYQIPFTQENTGYDYQLRPYSPVGKDIYPFNDNINAIVIENFERKVDNIVHKQGGIQFHDSKNRLPGLPEQQQADLFYTNNAFDPPKFPEFKFLIPGDKPGKQFPFNAILLKRPSEQSEKSTSNAVIMNPEDRDIANLQQIIKKEKSDAVLLDLDLLDNGKSTYDTIQFLNEEKIPCLIKKTVQSSDKDELICQLSTEFGTWMLEHRIQGLWIVSPGLSTETTEICFGMLQSTGMRITRTEFISCPTCARTSYDLENLLQDVQRKTSNLPGLKIAVMGCIVNGPGEMADADYGFVGSGNGKIHLYKGKETIIRNLKPSEAVENLLKVLKMRGFPIE